MLNEVYFTYSKTNNQIFNYFNYIKDIVAKGMNSDKLEFII